MPPAPMMSLAPPLLRRVAASGFRLALGLMLAGLAPAVTAAPPEAPPQRTDPGSGGATTGDLPLWELGLGVAAASLPHYRGSDQSRQWLLPLPYAVYRGRFLRANRDGARAVFVDSERLDLDVSISASPPTRSQDNRARRGMADLPATVEVGPNLNATLVRQPGWKLDLRLPLHAVLSAEASPRGLGWTLSPVLNLDLHAGGWNLGLQAGPRWADRRYHAFWYDVPVADATPERSAYRARGGYAGWRATASASSRRGPVWLGAFVRLDQLGGAVFADSPLVRRTQHWSLGLAVSWVAWTSDARVPDVD